MRFRLSRRRASRTDIIAPGRVSVVGRNINRRNKNGLFSRPSLPDEEKPLPCPSRER